MRIFRMEHRETKVGPFQTNPHSIDDGTLRREWLDKFYYPWHNRLLHKGFEIPQMDPVLQGLVDGVEFSACASEYDLRSWFGGFLPTLKRANMVIREYDVPDHDVRIGVNQLVFKRRKERLVREIPL